MTTHFRICISCSENSVHARRRAALVIHRLGKEFAPSTHISTRLCHDHPHRITKHHQEHSSKPADADLVIFILSSYLGFPPSYSEQPVSGQPPITRREWELLEALRTNQERKKPQQLLYRHEEGTQLRFQDEQELAILTQQWQALKRFSATSASQVNTFDTLNDLENRLEADLRPIIEHHIETNRSTIHTLRPWQSGSPFRGLQHFTQNHYKVFFGREEAEKECIELLAQQIEAGNAFLWIVGVRGTGKSSLIQAGLLPQFSFPGCFPQVAWWRYAIYWPGKAHDNLWTGLALSLLHTKALPELAMTESDATKLGKRWQADPQDGNAMLQAAMQIAHAQPSTASGKISGRLVLVIDQMEALFSFPGITTKEKETFVHFLQLLAGSGVVWVIGAMRSDFLHHSITISRLGSMMNQHGVYHLLPPNNHEIKQMIQKPAIMAGFDLEVDQSRGTSLEKQLLNAMHDHPSHLPLLAFTLNELYRMDIKKAQKNHLTLKSYQQLGGLKKALAQQTERLSNALLSKSDNQVTVLPDLLRSLVTIDRKERTVLSRSRAIRKLATTTDHTQLLKQLVQQRLVIIDGDKKGASARFAHETILDHWPYLRKVIEETCFLQEAYQRLEIGSHLWFEQGCQPNDLLSEGLQLAEGEAWLLQRSDQLTASMITYIEHSISHHRQNQEPGEPQSKEEQEREIQPAEPNPAGSHPAEREPAELEPAELNTAAPNPAKRNPAEQKPHESLLPRHEEAEEIMQTTLFDLWEQLKQINRLDLLDQTLVKTLRYFSEPISNTLLTTEQQRQRAITIINLGDLLLLRGERQGAIVGIQQGIDIFTRLLEDQPDHSERLRDLAMGYEKLGNMLRTYGDIEAALQAYRSLLTISTQLTEQEPGNSQWQRDLWVSHHKIGEALQETHALSDALFHHQAALQISTDQLEEDPNHSAWQQDLCISHTLIGNVLHLQGDLASALTQYRASLIISQQVAQHNQNNIQQQRNLCSTHIKIGDLLQHQGHKMEALTEYHFDLDIRTQLVQRHPEHIELQRGLAISHERMGLMHEDLGQFLQAITHFQEEITLIETLFAEHAPKQLFPYDLDVPKKHLANLLSKTDQKLWNHSKAQPTETKKKKKKRGNAGNLRE